ncbi:hypothetical protein B484DRAFT_407811 [Ochromonadaceae sp. CCMP2298]|nr:hypothetical protein B484DRAFT_407811 [Ochromonadaceae sp. CCMP2298]
MVKVKKPNPKNSNQRAIAVRRVVHTSEDQQREAINDAHRVSLSKADFALLKNTRREGFVFPDVRVVMYRESVITSFTVASFTVRDFETGTSIASQTRRNHLELYAVECPDITTWIGTKLFLPVSCGLVFAKKKYWIIWPAAYELANERITLKNLEQRLMTTPSLKERPLDGETEEDQEQRLAVAWEDARVNLWVARAHPNLYQLDTRALAFDAADKTFRNTCPQRHLREVRFDKWIQLRDDVAALKQSDNPDPTELTAARHARHDAAFVYRHYHPDSFDAFMEWNNNFQLEDHTYGEIQL